MNNGIRLEGSTAYVTLTKGYVAIIDCSDVELVGRYKWRADVRLRRDGVVRSVYVRTDVRHGEGKRSSLKLHRLLMGIPDGMKIDHRDGDGLNNTRRNLRVCTHSENMSNQRIRIDNASGFKGVNWHKGARRWKAEIHANNQLLYLGLYDTPEEAARAYDAAAIALHGEYARLNEPAA